MKKDSRKRLEQAGWAVGNASDFLGLSQTEEALVEIRLALGDEVRAYAWQSAKSSRTGVAATLR